MKCPNCGGNMGLEDEVCPFCNTPNTMAVQHQADMDHYREEYQRTQADVVAKTTLLQRHGSWLIILAVLLVLLMGGVILNVYAWDIGYDIRAKNVERGFAEDDSNWTPISRKAITGSSSATTTPTTLTSSTTTPIGACMPPLAHT